MAASLSGVDAFQVLRSVFDIDKNTLRVSIVDGSTGGGAFEVIISQTDDSIRIGDGTNLITATSLVGKVGLDVNVINPINIRDLDSSTDNVAIHDSGGNALKINPDGSLNVDISTTGTVIISYNEVTAVAISASATVAGYTVPSGKTLNLSNILFSSDVPASIIANINGVPIYKGRTHYTNYNLTTPFDELQISSGSTVSITAINNSIESVGSFNATILGELV